MSAEPYPSYGDDLRVSYWAKKAGSLPSQALAADLKALQKKHEAIDWKQFDPGWTKAAKTAAELDEAFARRDRTYRGTVFPIKRDVLDIAKQAKALEKGAAKAALDASKAIVKAANGYADAVDAGVDQLKSSYEQAKALLSKSNALSKEEDDEGDDEPGNVLLEPKRLLAMLNRCKRDPELSVNFAFVDGSDKKAAAFAMHPRMSGKKLFSALQLENGVKTGSFGTAWVQVDGEFAGTCLMLQLDKPLAGLVKKVRAPVKAAGFKIARAVLWSSDGTVFEQEDEPDDAPGVDAGTIPKGPDHTALSEAFKDRLRVVLALIRDAGDSEASAQARKLCADAGMQSGARDWAKVDALMTQAEALLKGAKAGSTVRGTGSAAAAKAGGDLAQQWQVTLAAWTPAIKAALTARGPDAAAMAKLFAQATALSKPGGDLSEALARLTECHELALAATRSSSAAPGAAGDGDAPMAAGTKQAPPMSLELAFRARLTGLVPRLKSVESAGGPLAVQIKTKRDAAVALVQLKGHSAEQMAQAASLLDEIESLIQAAESPSTVRGEGLDPGGDGRGGKVPGGASRPLVPIWTQAGERLMDQLSGLLVELRSHGNSELDRMAADMLETVSGYMDELGDVLEEFDGFEPEERESVAAEALDILKAQRGEMVGNRLLKAADSNPFGVKVELRRTIERALDEIEATFRA